jgi:hypothetical protein
MFFLLFEQALQWLRTYETWDTTLVWWLTPLLGFGLENAFLFIFGS